MAVKLLSFDKYTNIYDISNNDYIITKGKYIHWLILNYLEEIENILNIDLLNLIIHLNFALLFVFIYN